MKNNLRSLIFCSVLLLGTLVSSAQVVHLTPKPLSATLGTEPFTFGSNTDLLYPTFAGDSIKTILENFQRDFETVTGKTLSLSTTSVGAPFVLALDNTLATEEYNLTVTATSITIKAASPVGFFFALQSIKQLLPAALAAAKANSGITNWSVPAITIADKPRFPWRGFMLDCGRHFFDKTEVKKVLDIMATYKMNRFHWHLTEDQGWRIEIKKYPKLTQVGSVRKYSQIWSDPEGVYHDLIPYGPFFYTQEDIKEVVAYAKERFIEVIPEIDMPGHLQAAMAAYPEYSCTPTANHEVWTDYGVSGDVLNVANPSSVSFVKDILDEIIPLFPYKYIHLGGDECPTSAWQNNTACQALLASLGSTNYRDLQTNFFKQIETYLKNKVNVTDQRKVIAWNETLGGDLTGSNATIMAWVNWASDSKVAASKGLDVIMTPQIPYYINRKQSSGSNEPFSQGSGTETVEAVYAYEPIPTDATTAQLPYYKGVQANFWSEHVFQNSVLEYLMLPRIAAVAETGWTPKANKNFTDFVARIRQDSTLYQLNNWEYGKHYMTDQKKIMPLGSDVQESHWFRVISTTTTTVERTNRCIELLASGSPLISGTNTGSAVNVLWSNVLAAEGAGNYNYQWWCLKEDPSNPGYYALVNKALPNGSVNPTATATTTSGRWSYDVSTVNYSFVIGENYSLSGTTPSYSIRCKNYTGLYMNLSAIGQKYAMNVYNLPLDGNGGMFTFNSFLQTELEALKATLQEMNKCLTYPTYTTSTQVKIPGTYSAESATVLKSSIVPLSSIYTISTAAEAGALQTTLTNAISTFKSSLAYPAVGSDYYIVSTKYEGAKLYNGADNKLRYSTDPSVQNAEWTITASTPISGANAITALLKNKKTNYSFGQNMPVDLLLSSNNYKIVFNANDQDWEISGSSISNTNRLFPIPGVSLENPGCVSRDVIRALGTGWKIVPVNNSITEVAKQELVSMKVYSQQNLIIVAETDKPIQVYTMLGVAIHYDKTKRFNSGTYLVKVGDRVYKVVV